MAVPILLLLACELDLAITAGAIGLGLRRSHRLLTFFAAGLISVAFVTAVFLVWTLWFVAPLCVVSAGGCVAQAELNQAASYLAAGAIGQWALMLFVALSARRQTRGLAKVRVSGAT